MRNLRHLRTRRRQPNQQAPRGNWVTKPSLRFGQRGLSIISSTPSRSPTSTPIPSGNKSYGCKTPTACTNSRLSQRKKSCDSSPQEFLSIFPCLIRIELNKQNKPLKRPKQKRLTLSFAPIYLWPSRYSKSWKHFPPISLLQEDSE